jgi:predicted GTPase
MPYGDLSKQRVQRFGSRQDLDAAECTVEEREEYEPLLDAGNVVWAGVDYAEIVEQAERESDLILWDGGNNDFPFVQPDLHIVLVDPLRPGHETGYHPGEATLRMADVVVIPKVDSAADTDIERVERSVRAILPGVPVVRARSPVHLNGAEELRGLRVLVVDDGPTLTHGGMAYGAGMVAAIRAQAVVVDPRPWAPPEVAELYRRYPHLGPVLPAMGYQRDQLEALRQTLDAADVDAVIAGTPCDLAALVSIGKPIFRARYEFEEVGEPNLSQIVDEFLARTGGFDVSC